MAESASRGELYLSFKRDFCLEGYLVKLNKQRRVQLSKLRRSNLKFPIEAGRWLNIPREDRICTLCDMGVIGNEFHYLLVCCNPNIERIRKIHIPRYYFFNPTEDKLFGLLYYCNIKVLNNVALFLQKIMKYF